MLRRVIFIMLFLPQFASATTYFLRADGTAANKAAATSCSAASTAMSFATHNSQTFSGDDIVTICDNGGASPGATLIFPSSGTSGHPINYVVSGTPTVNASGLTYAINTNGKSFVTITGPLTLSGATSDDIYVNGSSNSTFTNVTATAASVSGWLIRGATNDTFTSDQGNSSVANEGFQADSNDTNLVFNSSSATGNHGDGFLLDGVTGCTFNGGSASGNGTASNEGNGIDILQENGGTPTTNCTINNFVSHDNFGNGIDVISVLLGDMGNSGIVVNGGQYYDNKTGASIAAGVRFDDNTKSSTIEYIQSYLNASAGIVVEAQSHDDIVVYNQVWSNNNGITQSNGAGLNNAYYGNVSYGNTQSGFANVSSSLASTVKNNIFVANGIGYTNDGTGSADTVAFNLNFGNTANYSGIAKPASDIAADPKFTNPGSDIFTLQAGSPAINAGANLGGSYALALLPSSTWPNGISTGNQNTYGSGWEIGAFLYTIDTINGSGISHGVTLFPGVTIQ